MEAERVVWVEPMPAVLKPVSLGPMKAVVASLLKVQPVVLVVLEPVSLRPIDAVVASLLKDQSVGPAGSMLVTATAPELVAARKPEPAVERVPELELEVTLSRSTL
jgi:hypothetical protein